MCLWWDFVCVQQRRWSDARRWQPSPAALPCSPSLPGTRTEGLFCDPKEIKLQLEDLELLPAERAHQKLGRRRGSMPISVVKLYFLAGWWWVLVLGLCCVCPMLLVPTSPLVRLNFFLGVIIALQWIKTLDESQAFVSIQANFLFVAMSEH